MTPVPDAERPTLVEAGLNFSGFGYYARPISPDDGRLAAAPEFANWLQLASLLDRLKSGDFAAAPSMLVLCRQSRDWRLKTVATRVLGHAAAVDVFRDMREEIEGLRVRDMDRVTVEVREVVLLYCRAFGSWGRLDVVPLLLDQYLTLRLKLTPEISLLPLLMARLLTDRNGSMVALEPPEDRIEDYLNLVMSEYEAVVEKIGSDKTVVFQGEPYWVRRIAERIRRPATPYPAVELAILRERFEPAVARDCSSMFNGSSVSTLTAAAIAEDFLDSEDAARYEPGVRYFFGHRIPD